ncbi:MAG: DNA repair protein RadA, partial [Anaerovoracaceae bacterium]
MKVKTVFVCQECGTESPKWMGQCSCGAWNSFVEEKILPVKGDDKRSRAKSSGKSSNRPEQLNKVISNSNQSRIDTGINEFNRVLGGGLVTGSLVLLSGEPGIGKSTVIMQAAANIAGSEGIVLYVSGEESEEQIRMRADRICNGIDDNLFILSETNIENIAAVTDTLKPKFIIIDSVQTMYSSEIDSAPGSVSQVRACGNELMRIGKVSNIPILIVAHVTKSGELAGPKIVEHLVDCVLSLFGESSQELRILRASKNRFGTTNEIGAFEMTSQGLMEVENLSQSFLANVDDEVEGSIVTAVYEGTRPLLLEIQALAAPTNLSFPRRTAIGIEISRLNMILAVLERKAGLVLSNQDIYVNVVGGLKPEGTSTDLAVALAIHSSFTGKTPKGKT